MAEDREVKIAGFGFGVLRLSFSLNDPSLDKSSFRLGSLCLLIEKSSTRLGFLPFNLYLEGSFFSSAR